MSNTAIPKSVLNLQIIDFPIFHQGLKFLSKTLFDKRRLLKKKIPLPVICQAWLLMWSQQNKTFHQQESSLVFIIDICVFLNFYTCYYLEFIKPIENEIYIS